MADGDARRSQLESRDRAEILDEWMATQLLTERQMYRLLQGPWAERLRKLSLLELDVITQIAANGQTVQALASTLKTDPAGLGKVTARLVRQRLLARQGRGAAAVLVRTEGADQVISLMRQAQGKLLVGIFRKMPTDLQGRTIKLMQALAPPPTGPTDT